MGNSISYIPVGLVAIGLAWAIRRLQPIILQVFIAVIAPVILSTIFAFVPELLHPSPPGENALAWTLILAATWAIVAVPVCLVAVIIFNLLQTRKKGKGNNSPTRSVER